MPSTYTLISSNVLTSDTASVTFSAIPSTYTDLVFRFSVRSTWALQFIATFVQFNGSGAANYSDTNLQGNGSAAASNRATGNGYLRIGNEPGSSATSNTFSSHELYIPNYTSSQNKVASCFSIAEDNSSTAYVHANALLWRVTDAINSITISDDAGSFPPTRS